MHFFPDNMVIELRRSFEGGYRAKSIHVTNIPVQLHEPPPVVVQTFGCGDTPNAALAELLNNIAKREST